MISSRSRYVSEYRKYQRTPRRMITSSKCRPRNSAGLLRVTLHRTRSAKVAFATEPNLEAASHLAQDNTLVQIQRAQSVTKLLLSDLRGVVSALRGEDPIGLGQALRALVAGVA